MRAVLQQNRGITIFLKWAFDLFLKTMSGSHTWLAGTTKCSSPSNSVAFQLRKSSCHFWNRWRKVFTYRVPKFPTWADTHGNTFGNRRTGGLSYESDDIKGEKHSDKYSSTHAQPKMTPHMHRRQRAPVLKTNVRQPCCIGRDNKMTQSVIIRLVPANKVVMPYLETRKSLSCYLVVHVRVYAINLNRN